MEKRHEAKLNMTSEELARLFGLLAMLEADGARDVVFHKFDGPRSLGNDLEDYICDHDFTD